MIFTIDGHIVPYTRTTQRSKWTPRYQRYAASQQRIAAKAREQMALNGWQMIARGTPLAVAIEIEMPSRLNSQDLDNQVKAILDALQGIAFENDFWVNDIWATRRLGDGHRAVIEIREMKG